MVDNMDCCANCFGDRGLREEVIPTFSKEMGTCSFCNTENIELIPPSALRDHFELLITIYVENENGKTLVSWFKEDWGMFIHHKMDHANACMLLAEILDDGDIVRKKFSPSELCLSDRLSLWGLFKNELMNENRFFPKNKMDENLFSKLLINLEVDPKEVSEIWYRARIQRGDKLYNVDEMGAPPKELASQGRANPVGIPYLYIASNTNTAVSEIRPHTGESVCVASFYIPDSLAVIDLRNPRNTVSPFIHNDEKKIASLRGDIDFLEHLGHELTRPVLPHVAAIDYLPTQYLCEFIKKNTYHGVLYNSSVGDGINLALFEPGQANVDKVEQHRVSRVSVHLEN